MTRHCKSVKRQLGEGLLFSDVWQDFSLGGFEHCRWVFFASGHGVSVVETSLPRPLARQKRCCRDESSTFEFL